MDIEKIAKICHELNRVYCQTIGDNSQVSWEASPEWQKNSAITGVNYHINNINSSPADSHNSWLKEKQETGWKYGPIKDADKKEHPCFVPYAELPIEQKIKDYLFCSVVKTLAPFL